ncbi:hypothetical protein [Streptomyces sp. CRN 30]|uniref:hypothetical protein n=1 Tax=Streptomyces sp. CRN 30 TaxID=3075613 RepID=UPI002A803D39|nr:hypothetical protein [Streptomyces sp. CRN 30]
MPPQQFPAAGRRDVLDTPLAEEPWCRYAPGSFPYRRELAALLADPWATPGR